MHSESLSRCHRFQMSRQQNLFFLMVSDFNEYWYLGVFWSEELVGNDEICIQGHFYQATSFKMAANKIIKLSMVSDFNENWYLGVFWSEELVSALSSDMGVVWGLLCLHAHRIKPIYYYSSSSSPNDLVRPNSQRLMIRSLLNFTGRWKSKMVAKIQKSSYLNGISFSSGLWCCELISIVGLVWWPFWIQNGCQNTRILRFGRNLISK